MYTPRVKSERPHQPLPPVRDEPTRDLQVVREGVELGAAGEEQAQAQQDAPAASSSNSRGPDLVQRQRKTFREHSTSPENPHDWTNFDIGRVVKLFRVGSDAQIRLSLRKLHTRWWHASEHVMKKFLQRVNVPDRVLQLIPEIVQTCRVCREWAKPGPSHQRSAEMSNTFNDQVECDLMFYRKVIIFHMIDRCTRWHSACIITDKQEATLMKAIDEQWVSLHGAPKELTVDGESGIVRSQLTREFLARKRHHPRPKRTRSTCKTY